MLIYYLLYSIHIYQRILDILKFIKIDFTMENKCTLSSKVCHRKLWVGSGFELYLRPLTVHTALKDILTLVGSWNTHSPNCVPITWKYVFSILWPSETIEQVVIINRMTLYNFKVLHSWSQNFPSTLASHASSMYWGIYSWANWNVERNLSQCLQQVRSKAGISGKCLSLNIRLTRKYEIRRKNSKLCMQKYFNQVYIFAN